MSSSSTNLNAMLKQQIKDAVAVIYDEQGTTAANRYSTPEQLSKALLDLLFPKEAEHNAEVTGVVRVPTVAESDSEGSTDSKKERKKRAPMTDEAKAQMKAKREATIAAKKAPAPAAPAAAEPPSDDEAKDKKARKPRAPMTDEAKAQMKAKREATIAAKKAAQA
jgi:hypothetical protein